MLYLFFKILVLFASARPPVLTEASLVNEFPKNPLLNEIIVLTPVAGHKFNLEAKNSCGNGALIEATEKNIKCQMTAPGSSILQLYTCDEKKTYCRAEGFDIKTQQPRGVKGWFLYYKKFLTNRDSWSTPERKGISLMPLVTGFENGDFAKVREQAKKERKNILIFFTQASCGPCREFKEVTLNSPEFQEATKNVIRYQLDVDVDMPQMLRDLKVPGTPTVVVMNKNSQELARLSGGATPKKFIKWLQQMPSIPIETLLDRKMEKLSDEEKFRVSSWYGQQWNDKAKVQAKLYADEIKNPNLYQSMSKSYLEKPDTLQGLQDWLQKNEALMSQAAATEDDRVASLYLEAIEMLIYEAVAAKDKKAFMESLTYGARQEKRILAVTDQLARDLDLYQLYESYAYAYKKFEDVKNAQAWEKKQLEVIERLVKIPYLPANSTYALRRAKLSGDVVAEQKIVSELQEKNKEDYSMALYGVYEKIEKKDFAGALELVDKGLAVAKDRSWQNTFILKLTVLREAKRGAEAQALIADVLEKTQLPNAIDLPVHRFVQNLRKEQVALHLLQ